MATQITWVIEAMDVKPQEGNYQDVVVVAHWRCNGVDGEFATSIYSTTAMGPIQSEFTPYADLTEQEVLDWVWAAGVDKTATEAAVAAQLEALKNPPIVSPALPWAQA